jgi:hypothetical protein
MLRGKIENRAGIRAGSDLCIMQFCGGKTEIPCRRCMAPAVSWHLLSGVGRLVVCTGQTKLRVLPVERSSKTGEKPEESVWRDAGGQPAVPGICRLWPPAGLASRFGCLCGLLVGAE